MSEMLLDMQLIEDVLAGRVTLETHPAVFRDDILRFSVRAVERADESWLLQALRGDHPGKAHVVDCLSRRLRNLVAPSIFDS